MRAVAIPARCFDGPLYSSRSRATVSDGIQGIIGSGVFSCALKIRLCLLLERAIKCEKEIRIAD